MTTIIKPIDLKIFHDEDDYCDYLDDIQDEHGTINHVRFFKENKIPKIEVFFKTDDAT